MVKHLRTLGQNLEMRPAALIASAMEFKVTNQLLCELIRLKNVPLDNQHSSMTSNFMSKQSSSKRVSVPGVSMTHSGKTSQYSSAMVDKNQQRLAINQIKQHCMQYEKEIEKLDQEMIRKKKGRGTMTHDEKVQQELRRSYNILR